MLAGIQHEFGASIWLVQSRLAMAQHWDGIEETRTLVRTYLAEAKQHPLVEILLDYIGKRVEATGLKDYLKTELLQLSARFNNDELARYLRTKLFELQDINTSNVAPTLFFEAQSCAIDYYETLIAILQAAASDRTLPPNIVTLVAKPLRALHRKTADRRLAGVMIGLGIVPDEGTPIDPQRAEIIELYTSAHYDAVVARLTTWFEGAPDDLPMHVLQVRACLHGSIAIPDTPGIVADIKKALASIVGAGPGFYGEALNLLTITDRHYGQSWASYLRAIVAYELREQDAQFPPVWLRDIYVRDPNVTPFTAVIATGESLTYLTNSTLLVQLFPRTVAIFNAVTRGVQDDSLAKDPRLGRYLGIYALANGDPAVALSHFEAMLNHGLRSDRIRCAGSAALACLQLDRLERAAGIIVDAFLDNDNVPSLLPLPAVVERLKDPVDWPLSIALPLVFELYGAYFKRDRMTHLRYAFERFQELNNIQQPEDLTGRMDEFGRGRVIAYLDRVWRPEVMRQTILYSGTREIEDARIRVCGVLATIDPDNSTNYLAEIRNRVKQQEISKATTLVEQSKVYVDIQAIKSALRNRLGDSYARYKQAHQTKDDPLLYRITEIVSGLQTKDAPLRHLLSSLHLMSQAPEAEADVQFAAIFAEVTNEFLRGEHGLNAYLSTRVRHGTLANTLRKPVADERLVTSRQDASTGYVENKLWVNDAVGKSQEWPIVRAQLEQFASKFDAVVDRLRDKLLQVRVLHELKDSGENSEALFVYRSSNLERRFFQASDRSFSDIDELVDSCVESLWEKTDVNLNRVQTALQKEIRQELMGAFGTLSDALSPYSYVVGVNEVNNAIARARTATSFRLNLVSSWFRRSEVYDRSDYTPEFPIQIAQNMISRTMSNASGWSGPEIRCEAPDGAQMPGRTLDAMVDIYYVLLENALRHSGMRAQELSVQIDVSLRDGAYSAKVENNWSASTRNAEALRRLVDVRASLKMAQSVQRAQLERGSGFHKVWVALNGPSYVEPRLDLSGDAADRFIVSFGCKIAGADSELPND